MTKLEEIHNMLPADPQYTKYLIEGLYHIAQNRGSSLTAINKMVQDNPADEALIYKALNDVYSALRGPKQEVKGR